MNTQAKRPCAISKNDQRMAESTGLEKSRADTRQNAHLMCPSAPCNKGAMLLGVVQSDGCVGFLPQPLRINEDFIAKARQGRRPEKRFRFTSRCEKSGCKQWTDNKCSVIDRVLRLAPINETGTEVPECAIRPSCRWHQQHGFAACKVCSIVITDSN